MHISFSVTEGVKWVHWLWPYCDVTLSLYSAFCSVSAINKPWTVLQKNSTVSLSHHPAFTVIIMTSPSGMMLSWSPHLSCLSFTHPIVWSSAVQKCATWLKRSSIHATGHNPPPQPTSWCDLAARPCVALPYSGSATHSPSHAQKTRTLSLWHTFCAFFHRTGHTHTHNVGKHTGKLREACPPPSHPPTHTTTHTYTHTHILIPVAEGALCIHWLIGQRLRRGSERLLGGGRWRQQETEGLERQTETDRGEGDKSSWGTEET